ncbi:MAG: hypothetical protein IPK76_03210 [Lewinellaceae bacterium]|nr:hypothetical protein [Lewinellaceae bacterium]
MQNNAPGGTTFVPDKWSGLVNEQTDQPEMTCSCPNNVVQNYSFENGTANWSWWGGSFQTGSYAAVCGSNSGQMQVTSSWGGVYQDISGLTPGTQINVASYAGTHNPNGNYAALAVEFYNSSWQLLSGGNEVEVNSLLPTMTYYQFNITVPAGTAYTRVVGKANGDWIKLDGVCINTNCNNATNGGTIAASQSACVASGGSFDPAAFTNVTSPSGGSGNLEYIWIKTTTNCPPASFDGNLWTTIAGATNASYDPGPITQTTCYRRCARRSGCTDYDAESNIVTVTINADLVFDITTTPVTVNGGSNGKIRVNVTSGNVPNYSYNWIKTGGETGSGSNITSEPFNITNLTAGEYSLTVSNGNGCTATVTAEIGQPGGGASCPNNFISNWSFETGSTSDWTCVSGDCYVNTGYPVDGTYNAYIYYTGGSTAEMSQTVNGVVPGGTYTLDFWGGTHKPQYSHQARLSFYNSSNALVGEFNSAEVDQDVDIAPYGLANYTLTAVAPAGASYVKVRFRATGDYFKLDAVCLTGPCMADITGLFFNDMNGSNDVAITNNGSYPLSSFMSGFNLEATVTGSPGSVRFTLSGAQSGSQTENAIPYNYPGTGTEWVPALGTYTMTVQSFSGANGTGSVCDEETFTFTLYCDPENNNAPPFCAPDPDCPSGNNFLWSQGINSSNGNGTTFSNMYCGGTTTYTIPGPYPAAFNGPVTVNISDAVSYDGYIGRNNKNQPNEKWRVQFKKSGAVVWSSSFTGDIPDMVTQGYWRGGLGTAFLPNGADQIIIQHWSVVNDCNSPNSVVPVSVCINYTLCNNATDGGTIAANQSACVASGGSFDPAAFTNVTSPSGGSGNLEYMWMMTTTNCPPATFNSNLWTTIVGATSATYNPGPITQTTCYRRFARRSGCSEYDAASNIVTVTINTIPTASISGPGSICTGQSATLTASGGGTYLWNTGATSTSISVSPVSNTTYTVTVTGSNGCTKTATKTITVNGLPAAAITGTSTICAGQNTTLTARGGGTYLWSTGATTTAITVSPGATTTYTVTVTNGNGCTASVSQTVTVNQLPNATASASPTTICAGQNSTLTATGGGTYLWSTGATAAAISVSPATTTTYTVTVTSGSGCTKTATATVTVKPLPNATASAAPATICAGQSSTVTATGGGTYLWNTGATTAAITVNPGTTTTYTVTVTGANGCTKTATATVTVLPLPNAAISGPSNICLLQSATLIASGGGTYLWSTGASSASISVTPLSTTTYTVTVTGANGCTETATQTVTVSLLPPAAISGPSEICNGQSATLTASGGGTYLWSTGAITPAITVSPTTTTTYTVVVTAGIGCVATATKTVAVNPLLVLSSSITNATCGLANGSINLTVTGGSPGFTYLWSNAFTGQDPSGLAAGAYTVTVTDSKGCTKTSSATITNVNGPSLSVSVTNVLCNGASTGAIDLTVTGGTSPIMYTWSNGFTGQDPSGLSAGTYTVTVSDGNNCTATTSATVTQPPAISLSTSVTNVLCNGASTGAINLTATGGTGSKTYIWSSGQTTEDLNYIAAGTYTVTVTDANGCTKTTSASVTQPGAMILSTTAVNSTCGNANGSIDLTVTGGTPAYTYMWSTGATIQDPIGLLAGTYTVTVTDANSCTKTTTATVNNTGGPNLSTVVTNVLCNGASTGAINLTVVGGTPSYTYLWSSGQTTQDLSNIAAGSYTVTVTDANQCTATTSATVTQPPAISLSTSVTNVLCNGASTGAINLTATGGTGSKTYIWSSGQTTEDLNNIAAGTYTVTVTDANGCTKTTSASVTQPGAMILSTTTVNSTCGNANGSIDLTVTGGTPAYTYMWSTGATIQDPIGLLAGTYTVTVTDANGCTKTTTATVNNTGGPNLSTVVTNVLCNGASTGAINLTVTGGTPSYTYLWSSGQTTQDLSNIAAGLYGHGYGCESVYCHNQRNDHPTTCHFPEHPSQTCCATALQPARST